MKKNSVPVIWGEAVIDAPGKVSVKSKAKSPKGSLGPGRYATKHIVIATGARPRVLPGLEPDKKLVWTYFEALNPDKCRSLFSSWGRATDRVISAVGVVGNVENLGLERLGVKIDRGTVVIDSQGRTSVPGIYAIGEVAGPPMLAHKAEHEGVICVEAIKGAHMIGAEVTELIQGYAIAMNLETTEEELIHTMFPHPTICETTKEAVLDAYARALNI